MGVWGQLLPTFANMMLELSLSVVATFQRSRGRGQKIFTYVPTFKALATPLYMCYVGYPLKVKTSIAY